MFIMISCTKCCVKNRKHATFLLTFGRFNFVYPPGKTGKIIHFLNCLCKYNPKTLILYAKVFVLTNEKAAFEHTLHKQKL